MKRSRAALLAPLLLVLPSLVHAQAPRAPRLAITVDDLLVNGPDPGLAELRRINERVTGALRDAKVPAVGFVNEVHLYKDGEVDARIALLESWLTSGFELGNHTFSHPDLNKIGPAAYEEDFLRGETVTRMLAEKHGGHLRLYRHTFLRTGKDAADKAAFDAFLSAHGYTAVPVTVENDDWWFNQKYLKARDAGDGALMKKVADAYIVHWTTMFDWYEALSKQLFKRNIDHVVLMHDNVLNAERLPEVLALMRARGYEFASVDEVMKDPAYGHVDKYTGPWGKSWLERWAEAEGIETLGKEPDPPEWFLKLYPEN